MKIGAFKLRDDEKAYTETWLNSFIADGCYKLRSQINKAFSEDEFIKFLAEQTQNKLPKKKQSKEDKKENQGYGKPESMSIPWPR